MQAIAELLATVVVWMAVATLSHLGIKIDLPRPEAKVERVIQRESAPAQKARVDEQPCPDSVPVKRKTTAVDA